MTDRARFPSSPDDGSGRSCPVGRHLTPVVVPMHREHFHLSWCEAARRWSLPQRL